jgi:tetratricopeptide (TPR) repeat protein
MNAGLPSKKRLMKKLIVVFLGAGVVLAVGYYANRPKPEKASMPSEIQQAEARPPEPLESAPAAPIQAIPVVQMPTAKPIAQSAPVPAATGAVANPHLDAALLKQAVDLLVSTEATRKQKRDTWKQLRAAGKLDPVITELEQRMTDDPRTAEYPAALGQAYLQKCGTLQDVREQGILAMQADKLFETALTLDPSNWEARFTKAMCMSYWPPVLNKGDEVIQNFQTLIEQQEAQAPQPHFAETYAWLGDQYQKSGRADDARAIWERGAALFPADDKLREKLGSIH